MTSDPADDDLANAILQDALSEPEETVWVYVDSDGRSARWTT